MMKTTVKKLKFWSRKKKKKKTPFEHSHNLYLHPPPTHHCCCCSCSSSLQPSAPPIPVWLDAQQTPEPAVFAAADRPGSSGFLADSSRAHLVTSSQDYVSEISPLCPTLPITNSSYQQYLVPNPAYGVPIVPAARAERAAGLFRRAASFGYHLIRCFCPCFRIREVY
ncbi:uncharacterized protein LOC131163713 [Malania oleifera]|uniref:uncharacterized protein LOC131163713 n=1 Tax=Malania oleifera TaxID=397392 RepID=UPI0025AE93E7|nr:uncharacterized protein LOC131163713 [Malania oleifera]